MFNRIDILRDKIEATNKSDNANLAELDELFNLFKNQIIELQDKTLDHWRHLATYQIDAAIHCEDLLEKVNWYTAAVQHLSLIPEKKRTLTDWRYLAEYQNDAGNACEDSLEQLKWYEAAVQSLSLGLSFFPENKQSLDNLRALAKYQKNAAQSCEDLEQQLKWYEAAIYSLSLGLSFTPQQDQSSDDWRDLAEYQNSAGSSHSDPKQQLKFYQEAHQSLFLILEKNRTFEDWRHLAGYLNNAGYICGENLELGEVTYELKCYEETIKCLLNIPEKDRTLEDWRLIAISQSNIGITIQDNQEKIKWFKDSIHTMSYIPEHKQTSEDWQSIILYQNNLALAYKDINQWKQAHYYFSSCLDNYNNDIDIQKIATIYDHLQKMELDCSINQKLYSFAYHLFSDEDYSEVKNDFLKIHLTIINSSSSQPNASHHGLLQLMRLLASATKTLTFSNENVKTWLTNQNDYDQFTKSLKELENICKPLSLLESIGQAPTFSIAITNKMLILNEEIAELKKEIRSLKIKTQRSSLSFKSNSKCYHQFFNVIDHQNKDNKFIRRSFSL